MELQRSLLDIVEIKHLRAAMAAAELQSFSRAAGRLRIKNSTLSQHISLLESCLGTTLFRRSPRGVVPTVAGASFLRSARHVLVALNGVFEMTRAVGQGASGSLRVGFIASITAGNLRSSLSAFSDHYPDVSLESFEDTPKELLAMLDTGSLDILIIAGSASPPETECLRLWSEAIYIALPADHPLAAQETVYWPDLRKETFLAPRTTAEDIQALVSSRLLSPGNTPMLISTNVSRESVLAAVGLGKGITIVSAASLGLRLDNVVYRELRDGAVPHLQAYSAYWRRENRNPTLHTFLAFLRERYSLASSGD